MTEQGAPQPGWYTDPTGRHEYRWWDGGQWRDAVASRGMRSDDPLDRNQGAHASDAAAAERSPAHAAGPGWEQHIETNTAGIPAVVPESPDAKISMFNAKKVAEDLRAENRALRQRGTALEQAVRELGALDAAEILQRAETLRAAQDDVERSLEAKRHEVHAVWEELRAVQDQIIVSRERVELEERGLFDYEHVAEASAALATELESVKSEIKSLNRYDRAIHASKNFMFNNSAAKGKTFVNQMSRIMLRAYNAEAENAAKTVRAGSLDAARRRLSSAKDQIEKQGTMIELRLDPQYHFLRLKEIELAARHLKALAAEKELERARREELREQRKVEQELKAEKERLEKERRHYVNSIERLRAAGDTEAADELAQRLGEIDEEIRQADYRVANIRAGYVYVISNVGAFGEGVVKIGMTRRLDPMDRVKELGDASVPFTFDVHALFFSDDAVGVEAALHRQFSGQRLNQVNLRKEFFRVTPDAVLEALQQRKVSVLEFRAEAAAEDFRASQAILARD